MFKNKVLNFKLTAVLIVIILCGLTILTPIKDNEAIRNINVDSIGTMSFEEKSAQLLEQFDTYESGFLEEDGSIHFKGKVTISTKELFNFEFVNNYNEEVIKIHETTLNSETMEFKVITKYYQNDEIIHEESQIATPNYIEEDDDWVFEQGGDVISLKETLLSDNLENCVALVDDATIAVAVLLIITVVVCAPYIVQTITSVVQTVVVWVKSFWSWLKGLFKTTTTTATVVTTTYYYKVNVGTKEHTLEKVKDKTRTFQKNKYFLAIADTEDGFVYISKASVSLEEAIAVLASTTLVNALSGSNKSFVLSTYTLLLDDAEMAAAGAATVMGVSGVVPHSYHNNTGIKKGVYYMHFHPGFPYIPGSSHSFYGTPYINL